MDMNLARNGKRKGKEQIKPDFSVTVLNRFLWDFASMNFIPGEKEKEKIISSQVINTCKL